MLRNRPLPIILAMAAIVMLDPGTLRAAATSPIILAPTDPEKGEIFSPAIRLTANLTEDYIEEEFLVSGTATVYTYAENPVRDELIALDEDLPYTTRIIVRRPRKAADFTGTVVIEWWNSSAGFDTAPVWDPSAEFFAREGWIYVGFTNSTTSLQFLKGGCTLFQIIELARCKRRYRGLAMEENGQAFEMGSQLAHALKTGGAGSPLPADFKVKRLFHAGQSQQGGSMITYATAFHFEANDGYFVQAASGARPINFQPACGEEEAPAYPDCTPRLEGEDRLVRTDLPVPVYRAVTETDLDFLSALGNAQDDTESFRYYETAGTAHSTVHKNVEPLPGLLLEDFCGLPLNTIADGPVFGSYLYNSMWKNMERQVRTAEVPPHGERIELLEGEIVRDVYGNARGGIRLPQMDVPIATYSPTNVVADDAPEVLAALAGLFCALSGVETRFDDETLDTLYPTHADYVSQFNQATRRLMAEGFLLPADAAKLMFGAVVSRVGANCGIGAELALLLPAVFGVRRLRRRPRR